jgi:glycogen(starch) synthase
MLAKSHLREIAWEIGQLWSSELTVEYLALSMVSPHLGLVHWHVQEDSLEAFRKDPRFARAPLVVRVYDVTDLLFDGTNAHGFFDLEVANSVGNYYFNPPRLGRDYLAEIGLRAEEGVFVALLRSNKVFFERDRPAGNYQTAGLFVGGGRKFPVENVLDAKVFETMHRTLAEGGMPQMLRVALVFADFEPAETPLNSYVLEFASGIDKFGGQAQVFPLLLKESDRISAKALLAKRGVLAEKLTLELTAAHRQKPFSLIHCHDWYAAACALKAAEQLKLPVILTLRSTEYERAQGYQTDHLAEAICEWERKVIQAACLIITPHSSTRQQVINLYGAPPDKVALVQGLSPAKPCAPTPDPARIKADLGLNPLAPTGLFAGEVSHAAGADLLLEALAQVCHRQPSLQFLFAGDGPLKSELEARAWHSGIGQRVRFLGDVSSARFASILAACDFVVIPARTWQDEGLAQMAIEAGKPVLTTHQAGIGCIVHGQNGLIAYDNPGSIIWGIEELLHHPLQAELQRLAARKKSDRQVSLDNLVAQHYLYYATALKNLHG